jgi:hypothetical protein
MSAIVRAAASLSCTTGVFSAVCPIRTALTSTDAGSWRSIEIELRRYSGPSTLPNSAFTR